MILDIKAKLEFPFTEISFRFRSFVVKITISLLIV